jgi:large subunit ribosomal protein L28
VRLVSVVRCRPPSRRVISIKAMSKVCELTGKTVQYGNNVSHANNRTRRRFLPNLQKKRIWVAEENRFVTLRISTRAMRTLDKKGYTAMVKEMEAKGAL